MATIQRVLGSTHTRFKINFSQKNLGHDFDPPRKKTLMNGIFGHDFVVFRPKVKEILNFK